MKCISIETDKPLVHIEQDSIETGNWIDSLSCMYTAKLKV